MGPVEDVVYQWSPGIVPNIIGSFPYKDMVPRNNKQVGECSNASDSYSLQTAKEDTAVIDSGATSSFWRTTDTHVKTGIPSTKVVTMPTAERPPKPQKRRYTQIPD